jgi:hypothetical protein
MKKMMASVQMMLLIGLPGAIKIGTMSSTIMTTMMSMMIDWIVDQDAVGEEFEIATTGLPLL